MENRYGSLLDYFPGKVAEKTSRYRAFTEKHMQTLWLEQKHFTPLRTEEGLIVHVISPGLWNTEAGPDFKKAHLVIGDQEVRGDVELHLTDNGWTDHSHNSDNRYNDVVFHLSLWGSKKILTNASGSTFHQAYLEPALTQSLDKIVRETDLDLYPYRIHTGSGRCSEGLFKIKSEDEVSDFFHNASQWRLQQKHDFLDTHTLHPSTPFVTGIVRALGYKNNAEAFLKITHLLQDCPEMTPDQHLSLALGVCGFFGLYHRKKWGDSEYYENLRTIFQSLSYDELPAITLSLHNIRPYNHPIRRLAYLVAMLHDHEIHKSSQQILNSWSSQWESIATPKDWRRLRNEVADIIPDYDHPHFCYNYTFQPNNKDKHLPLIGATTKETILVNAFFPILYEKVLKDGDAHQMKAFKEFYQSMRSPETGKSKYLTQRFFGQSPMSQLMNRADIQQGAYQLHHDFCTHFEGSCEGCPFLERYETVF